MTDELWKVIKDFYYGKFGIVPELVEIAPVLDLLRLCASGSSNKSIAEFFNENEEWLADLFDAYLGFRGWSVDLSFSPLQKYKDWGLPDSELFRDSVILNYGQTNLSVIELMYKSAAMVEKLERLFDEQWI